MQTFIVMCTAKFKLTFLDGHLLQELVPSRSGYVGNFDHLEALNEDTIRTRSRNGRCLYIIIIMYFRDI